MVVHSEIEVLYGTLRQPLCENNAGRDAFEDIDRAVSMTDRDEEVTCKRCLKAMGALPQKAAQEQLLNLTVKQITGGRFQVAA